MISSEQKLQIEQYLISKNLSLDILLEIKDHIILQVEDCMCSNTVNFDEAFSKVKEIWENNLTPTTYWFFYGRQKMPKIAKTIIKNKFQPIIIQSLLIGSLFFVLSLVMVFFADSLETYRIYYIAINSLLLSIPIILFCLNFKYINYFKRSFVYKGRINYSFYQQNLILMVVCSMGQIQSLIKGGDLLYQFFISGKDVSVFVLIAISLYRFSLIVLFVFGIINFLEHKRTLKQLQILN